MTVKIYGQEFDCAKAVKGPDFVQLYDKDGTMTAEYSGIRNFDGYEIAGPGEWAIAPASPSDEDLVSMQRQTDEALISLYEGQARQDAIIAQQDEAIIAIYETGGAI